jgi:hypothetical protein
MGARRQPRPSTAENRARADPNSHEAAGDGYSVTRDNDPCSGKRLSLTQPMESKVVRRGEKFAEEDRLLLL